MPFFLIIIFIFLTKHFLTLMFTEDHNCLKKFYSILNFKVEKSIRKLFIFKFCIIIMFFKLLF